MADYSRYQYVKVVKEDKIATVTLNRPEAYNALSMRLSDELVQAIHEVHRGEASLHPLVARKLLQELSQSLPQSPGSLPLTDRELEVLRLVAQGQHNRQIADALQIRETTVRTHISSILKKLHLTSRTQAALFALREGLASLDDARN